MWQCDRGLRYYSRHLVNTHLFAIRAVDEEFCIFIRSWRRLTLIRIRMTVCRITMHTSTSSHIYAFIAVEVTAPWEYSYYVRYILMNNRYDYSGAKGEKRSEAGLSAIMKNIVTLTSLLFVEKKKTLCRAFLDRSLLTWENGYYTSKTKSRLIVISFSSHIAQRGMHREESSKLCNIVIPAMMGLKSSLILFALLQFFCHKFFRFLIYFTLKVNFIFFHVLANIGF